LEWFTRASGQNLFSKSNKPIAETNHFSYFISSLPPDAKLLATYVRKNWTLENQLHWSMDLNFTEDTSRLNVGNGAAIFGHLRRNALSGFKQDTSLAKTSQPKKRTQSGSVEKYRAPENHEVVSQHDEGEFADLSPATSRPDVVSKSAFDHRDDGLHLDSLPIGLKVKADLHESSVLAGGRFARGAYIFG
jgi:hypothetical protein